MDEDRLYNLMKLWFRTEFIQRDENTEVKSKSGNIILNNPSELYYHFVLEVMKLTADLSVDSDGIYLFNNKFFFVSIKELSPKELIIYKDIIKHRKDIFRDLNYDYCFASLTNIYNGLINKKIPPIIKTNIIISFINYCFEINGNIAKEISINIEKKYFYYYRWANQSLMMRLNMIYHYLNRNEIIIGNNEEQIYFCNLIFYLEQCIRHINNEISEPINLEDY